MIQNDENGIENSWNNRNNQLVDFFCSLDIVIFKFKVPMSNSTATAVSLDIRYFSFENNNAQLTKKVNRWLFLQYYICDELPSSVHMYLPFKR